MVDGRGTAVILVNEEGEILLQLRDDIEGIWHPGMWSMFGGNIEPHETPKECAKREMKEETGIEIDELEQIAHFVSCINYEQYLYTAETGLEGEIEAYEGQKGKFFTVEEAKELEDLAPTAREMIEKYEEFKANSNPS